MLALAEPCDPLPRATLVAWEAYAERWHADLLERYRATRAAMRRKRARRPMMILLEQYFVAFLLARGAPTRGAKRERARLTTLLPSYATMTEAELEADIRLLQRLQPSDAPPAWYEHSRARMRAKWEGWHPRSQPSGDAS